MKLYYSPGACSLADRISLVEAGIPSEFVRVDLKTKRAEDGSDYLTVNPKGYVPALMLDDGEVVTENVAVLSWIAERAPQLVPTGPLGRIRLIEALAFVSSEVHKAFEPMFKSAEADGERAKAIETISRHYINLAQTFRGPYLFGDRFTVADAYLFVTLTWAGRFGISVPDLLVAFFARMLDRLSVRDALKREGLEVESPFGIRAPSPGGVEIDTYVRENPAEHRFERRIHNNATAAAYYRIDNGRLVFIHVEVPAEFSGSGIGNELVRGTFERLRASGRKAVLRCPFFSEFYAKHPEYADVVDG